MPTHRPSDVTAPPQIERAGGLFGGLRVNATTAARTMTADATAKNQRLATARSYSGHLATSLVIWSRPVTPVRRVA